MSVTTIWNLLNDEMPNLSIKRGINIPMIQRDYVQGRKNNKTSEIRKIFLNNLLKSTQGVINENKQPLELDFIYGYAESEAFIPLDGQQRLTTLFLLHWYFAFKENKLEEYKLPFSKFKYQTRQSSENFIHNMVSHLTSDDYKRVFEDKESFETVINDKNWYFVNWRYDLTIQSMIVMLDEIHTVFNTTEIQFNDFINVEKPPVVFNFLNIKDFGLSDDLYIKMNSRGKHLNDFENLKAELGRFIEYSDFNDAYNFELAHSNGYRQVNVETYFVTKIDTTWTDYFWKIRDKKTNAFDDKLLNLLAFISLNEQIRSNLDKFNISIKELKNNTELSYYKFIELDLLNEFSIINYIEILDILVSKNQLIQDYLKEAGVLNKENIINQSFSYDFNAIYEKRILFYAVFKFLIKTKDAINKEELNKWDRLLRNLIEHTNYNKPSDFRNSILSIDAIIERYNGDIYQTILDNKIKGFDTQQIQEEKLKIQLISKSDKWKSIILEIESEEYLNGQIMLLLAFSGIYKEYVNKNLTLSLNENEEEFYGTLEKYFLKYKELFTNTGLRKFEDEIFRRALLTKGDYLLYKSNWSLLIDNHRDISWKRLFKETGNLTSDDFIKKTSYLKSLFDEIDISNTKGSLISIINNSTVKDWRKDLIENPIIIQNSERYYLKFFHNGRTINIYSLKSSKYNRKRDQEIKITLVKQELIRKGFQERHIELGFIESLNQYGIIRLKRKKPKIVYNSIYEGKYLIDQHGKEDIILNELNEVIHYIIENYAH